MVTLFTLVLCEWSCEVSSAAVSVKVVFARGLKNSPFRINGHPSGCCFFLSLANVY